VTVLSLVVLISGGGSNLRALLDAQSDAEFPARIVAVGADNDAAGLSHAEEFGVPTFTVPPTSFESRAAWGDELLEQIEVWSPDLVVCAGWLTLLKVPERYKNRVVNVHPALLPAFGGKGMYGHHVHEAVVQHGCKLSGCTVHLVDDEYDHGPIVLQRSCPVHDSDTPEQLAARVQAEERVALPEAIRLFAEGRLEVRGRRVTLRPASP
jgi:phosphoribosylglycinamide formyltransferase-1